MNAVARFWGKVDTSGECWEWTAGKDAEGYGLHIVDRKNVRATRFAYELMVGPIPDGLQIDHLCRNHGCVNPAHLEAVSCRENVLRGVGPTALNARKTHCVHGHEFTTENTQVRVRRDGGRERVCSRCRAERSAVGRARYADNLATA